MEVTVIMIIILFLLYLLLESKKNTDNTRSIYFQEKLKQLRKTKNHILLEKTKEYLNKIFDYILTEDQINAVINDSKNCMVIASAGSGKTSTIIAKYGYLNQLRSVSDKEILILAFNNKVSKEIKEKIDTSFHVDSHVKTFHSLETI